MQPTSPSKGARSGEDIVRGSTNIPLSAAGRDQAVERAIQFKRKGSIDSIISSSLNRAVQTAEAIKEINPKAMFSEVTAALHPWYLGGLEGQPTNSILPQMNALILQYPDRLPPQPAADSQSTEPGQTFNQFCRRVFNYLGPVFQRYLAFPQQKIVVIVHYRDLKLLQAWEANGFLRDYSVDRKEVVRKDGEPGDVWLLCATEITKQLSGNWGKWHFSKVNMESMDSLQNGIYFMRHGYTEWNAENPGSARMPDYAMSKGSGPFA